jgi:hypothetical protein
MTENEPDIRPASFPDAETLALWIAYNLVCRVRGLQDLKDANLDDYVKRVGELRDKLLHVPKDPGKGALGDASPAKT